MWDDRSSCLHSAVVSRSTRRASLLPREATLRRSHARVQQFRTSSSQSFQSCYRLPKGLPVYFDKLTFLGLSPADNRRRREKSDCLCQRLARLRGSLRLFSIWLIFADLERL